MPPAKARDESRSEASTARDRQVAAAAHARKSKNGTSAPQNGSSLKELALVSTESGNVVAPGQGTGMAWNDAPLQLLNTYRVAHNLPSPAAFTSPLSQALLTNPGIGRQSPSMARKKEKRRVSKDQLALSVRKHFNSAAVNEIDVAAGLFYKVHNKEKAFRMRSAPGVTKKQ
ncbi:uncharacterized protein LTR77_007809 [Saxophila tyrrhenica]|uniref:Histone deacetylase complex subunit SAP30 Sin3 binding domain-containing protein n=1 Tax=Saxophila tyrrhenica TaxID=1690608 RepID=A0AAV9P536_9PEZI|nr:hypothetical protein LTR77_007809 [Saxophila tyrrhenica]